MVCWRASRVLKAVCLSGLLGFMCAFLVRASGVVDVCKDKES